NSTLSPASMPTWAARLVLAASVLVSAITWNQRRNPTGTLIIFSRSPLQSRCGSLRLIGNCGQLGVVWVIFGAFGARKGDKTSRGAGCEPYSSRPPTVEGSFDLRPPGSAL